MKKKKYYLIIPIIALAISLLAYFVWRHNEGYYKKPEYLTYPRIADKPPDDITILLDEFETCMNIFKKNKSSHRSPIEGGKFYGTSHQDYFDPTRKPPNMRWISRSVFYIRLDSREKHSYVKIMWHKDASIIRESIQKRKESVKFDILECDLPPFGKKCFYLEYPVSKGKSFISYKNNIEYEIYVKSRNQSVFKKVHSCMEKSVDYYYKTRKEKLDRNEPEQ